jgi:hypothetical protein
VRNVGSDAPALWSAIRTLQWGLVVIVADPMLARQAQVSTKGFFFGRTPHDSKHLNRWRGRKDTKHCTRVLVPACQRGTGVVSRASGETNLEMNESLPYGVSSLLSVGQVGSGKPRLSPLGKLCLKGDKDG